MKSRIKIIPILLVIIILLNSSPIYAFSFSFFSNRKSIENNTQVVAMDTNNSNDKSSFSERIKNFINTARKNIETTIKRKQDVQTRKQENAKVKSITIPEFEEISQKVDNQKSNREYTRSLLGSYVTDYNDTVSLLTDVLTSIKELNIDRNKIKVAISQLLKALKYSNGSIPTQQDIDNLEEEKKKYYQLDKDENGNLISDDVEVTYSSLQNMAIFDNYARVGYERANGAPIGIGKVKVHTVDTKNNTTEDIDDVYYVALSGTNFTEGQSCGLIADVLSGIETNSPYLQNATKAITENVPKGSKIILSGFSLGGMMAQQLLVQEEIISNYEIVCVSLLGCPALCVDERAEMFKKYNVDIPVNRVIDEYDLIPYMSVDWFLDKEPKEIIENLYKEDRDNPQQYKTFLDTHVLAYMEQDCYKKYDVLCNPIDNGKQTTITLKHGDFKYFDAPTKFLHGYFSQYE